MITPPVSQQFGNVAAISPDGNILAITSRCGLQAVDVRSQDQLWSAEPLVQEGCIIKHLVIGGKKGQFLFAAGAHTLERWNVATDRKLAVLAGNQPIIKALEVSRDGRVALAEGDSDCSGGSSFQRRGWSGERG